MVTLRVVDGAIVIAAEKESRAGWEEAAALASERQDDSQLDELTPASFDQDEWEW